MARFPAEQSQSGNLSQADLFRITHQQINPTQIVPIGPVLELEEPHGRERL